MDITNKVLFILDDSADAEAITSTFNGFCEDMRGKVPVGTLFVPSNLRALEKVPDWQSMVKLRIEDTPSPGIEAQLYQAAVFEAMQGKTVYMMVRGGTGWSYRIATPLTDYSPLSEGRLDPRPNPQKAIE